MLTAEVFQLFQVKLRGAFAYTVKVKPFLRLRVSEKFIIAVAPPQPREVVPHASGREPHNLIFLRAQRAVTLGELLAIRTMDQWNMRPDRHVPAHRLIDHHLPGGIVQVIVAADNVGYAHVVIVHHNSQHIDRRAVGAQQDHIVELVIANCHIALNLIADHGGAFQWCLDADHIRRVGMAGRITVTPR